MTAPKLFFAVLALVLSLGSQALAGSDKWRDLSPKDKDRVRRNYDRWEKLPPQDKDHLREEWDRYNRLPQDQRDRIKQRFNDQRGHRD